MKTASSLVYSDADCSQGLLERKKCLHSSVGDEEGLEVDGNFDGLVDGWSEGDILGAIVSVQYVRTNSIVINPSSMS